MPVYIDLDGPILDVSEKYYRVHQAILCNAGCTSGDKVEFWSLKRERVMTAELLSRSCPNLKAEAYLKAWLDRIETSEFLEFDSIVPGAIEVLERLVAQYHLYLVTLRRSQDRLLWELATLGLSHFFAGVLCGHSDTVPGWQVKAELIHGARFAARGRGVLIGDTEVDILAGKELGLTTVAVTNGIRARRLLEGLEPDFIIADITGLPPLLEAVRVDGRSPQA